MVERKGVRKELVKSSLSLSILQDRRTGHQSEAQQGMASGEQARSLEKAESQ